MPPSKRKNPSGVRSSPMNWRSRGSTSLVISLALLASVRAIRTVGTPRTSAASRAAISFCSNSEVGTSTLPPMWPHFLAEES